MQHSKCVRVRVHTCMCMCVCQMKSRQSSPFLTQQGNKHILIVSHTPIIVNGPVWGQTMLSLCRNNACCVVCVRPQAVFMLIAHLGMIRDQCGFIR